jgi:DNA polymerase V
MDAADHAKSARLMAAMDAINQTHGRGSLVPASTTLGKDWRMKQESRSPSYTTRIEDVPVVRA